MISDHDLLIRIDERVHDLIENDKKQNGALAAVIQESAESKLDNAVMNGQFRLVKWAISIGGVVGVLLAIDTLKGYAP